MKSWELGESSFRRTNLEQYLESWEKVHSEEQTWNNILRVGRKFIQKNKLGTISWELGESSFRRTNLEQYVITNYYWNVKTRDFQIRDLGRVGYCFQSIAKILYFKFFEKSHIKVYLMLYIISVPKCFY